MTTDQGKKTLVVDFDSTIADNAWPHLVNAELKPGVLEALSRLQDTFYIIIHSCRYAARGTPLNSHLELTPKEKDRAYSDLISWLEEHEIPFDEVWEADKPGALYYIDDKAITYNDDSNYVGNKFEWCKIADYIMSREDSD